MKKVKRVEIVGENEFDDKTNPLGPIVGLFATRGNGTRPWLKFVYNGLDGEVEERAFGKVSVGDKGFFKDNFNESTNLCVVKIWYEDGDTEWGFKWFTREPRKWERRRKTLRSVYLKDGVFTDQIPDFGDVRECYDTDKWSRVPAWILELLPMYNEDVAAKVEEWHAENMRHAGGDGTNPVYRGRTMRDWANVAEVFTSSYVGWDVPFSWGKDSNGRRIGANWKITNLVQADWKFNFTSWDGDVCVNESGSKMFDGPDGEHPTFVPVVSAYSYLKSFYLSYEGRQYTRNHLIPLSELLLIRDDSTSDSGNKVVWTNLDETLKGNV